MRARCGFTLVELLIVVAIIAILAGILLPVFFSAKGKAQTTTCQSNLKQIGNALRQYTDDADGHFPPAAFLAGHVPIGGYYDFTYYVTWPELLLTYGADPGVFQCPTRPLKQANMTFNTFPCGYFYNSAVGPDGSSIPMSAVSAVQFPSTTIVAADGWGLEVAAWPASEMAALYSGQSIYGVDATKVLRHHGHANFLFADTHVKALKSTPASQWTMAGDPN